MFPSNGTPSFTVELSTRFLILNAGKRETPASKKEPYAFLDRRRKRPYKYLKITVLPFISVMLSRRSYRVPGTILSTLPE